LITRNKKYTKYLVTDGHSPQYIKKKNIALAEDLAYKQFLQYKLNLLNYQLSSYQKDLSHQTNLQESLDKFVTNPLITPLLSHHITKHQTLSESQLAWANEPYIKNHKHPEHLINESVNGLMVRSKSESLIAISLSQHNIPFRYECLLPDSIIDLYPDFTILRPYDGKIFYWEHFGLIESDNYNNDNYRKMVTYSMSNVFIGDNLITSCETSSNPLSYSAIEKLISVYLLP